MAVLKHIAIKNADYSAAVCYLKYQHDERHLKPLLDENGSMMLRSEFHMNGVNCNPDTFDLECEMLNDQYRKNYRYDEVKSHHYIISFDPRDKDEHHLTGEKAQTLGLEFVKNHLPGHQALVCTHTDGHNGSGNIHVHIIINSLRKLDIEPQSYTTRSIDCKAGYKHHLTKDYLKYLQQELMNLCQRENLYQVDLLSPAQHKITEAEYWLQKRGQKELEDINEQIIADGMNPMETTFQTRKQFVRNAISEISSSAISFEDFQSQLFEKYKIHVKENRGRYSYLHPEREKYISGRSLGTNFDKDYLLKLFEANALAAEQEEKQRQAMPDYHADPIAILFIRSDLRLVVDLQNCIKAQQSSAYAQKVKISNLQQMAKTVAYIQENGFDTRENLQTTYDSITLQMHDARQKTKDTETQIKSVNEQIHYLGQYLSTKSTYNEFLKARFKGKFRKDHADEIEKHEKAAQILKAQNPDGSLPKMKDLKLEKERLLALKAAQYDTYTYYKDYQKELRTACANVDSILGQHHIRDHIQRTEQTL